MSILIVYLADIILIRDNKEEINKLIDVIVKKFKMKFLNFSKYFLSMLITRSSKEIHVSQQKYTLNLPKKIGLLGCKVVNTQMDLLNKFDT